MTVALMLVMFDQAFLTTYYNFMVEAEEFLLKF